MAVVYLTVDAAGININQKGEHGFTPLAVAEDFGHAGVAEMLRSLGAMRAGSLDTPSDPDSRAAHLRRLDEGIHSAKGN